MVGVHVLREAVEVALLLDELLLELNELLLLALADGVILVGLLPSLERVAGRMISAVRGAINCRGVAIDNCVSLGRGKARRLTLRRQSWEASR